MRDPQPVPTGAEDIGTHDANGAVILGHGAGLHPDIEPQDAGMEGDGGVQVWDGQARMENGGGWQSPVPIQTIQTGVTTSKKFYPSLFPKSGVILVAEHPLDRDLHRLG